MKSLKDIPELKGKKIIVRVDFNVPLDDQGNVENDKRIQHALPTINYLLENGAEKIILMTHIGRPKDNDPELKTDSVAEKFSGLIGQKVAKVDGWGEDGLPGEKIVMLENLRFNTGEKNKDETERDVFGKQLACLADIYVNEAFSNSHREHASMTSVPKYIPGYAGFGVEKEIQQIKKAMEAPEHPVVAVIGGVKADKLTAVNNLLNIADSILIAGALSASLLKAKGKDMGASKIDDEGIKNMHDVVDKIIGSEKIILPVDFVAAKEISETSESKNISADEVKGEWMALDIGPETAGHYTAKLKEAKTILWFGPIGVFEVLQFSHGTRMMAKVIAESDAVSIVGGGDSASAVEKLGLEDEMTLVSTGGGASLAMIEGKELTAIKALGQYHS